MSITTAKDRLSTLVDQLTSTLATSYNVNLTAAQVTELKRVSGVWLDGTATKVVTLSDNKPDYNQIMLQFQNMLEHEDSWRDTLTAGAGQSILRFISAAVAYAVYAQERSTQERYSYLARLPSSIFAGARSLGVRIIRRTPALVTVSLTRTGGDALVIPPFTAFTVGGVKFFNRTAISFGKGTIAAVEAVLTQGEIFTDTYNSPGQPFATYEVGHGEGTMSEDDVYLYVNDEQYTRVTDGFYNYNADAKVFYENTMANGNVEVITGSGNYAVMPPSNATIQIIYATTDGVDAENATAELPVLCPDFTIVNGQSLTPIAGAGVPRTPEFYRVNAPYIYSRRDRSVIRRDYELTAIEYPNQTIYDARAVGQQEIDPTARWAMGVIKICPLTDVLMTDTQWLQFATYMQGKAIEGMTILRQDPVPYPIDISIRLGINANFSLESARLAGNAEILNAYAPQQGSLGRDFYRHDLSSTLLGSTDPALRGAINWIEIDAPVISSITLDWFQYIKVNSLTLTTEYTARNYSNRIGYDQSV